MPVTGPAGSRIRERRIALGVKQSALAREAGISAAYLNLIEHNRRPVAGKLLARLAAVLDIGVDQLARGVAPALILALHDAAASDLTPGGTAVEADIGTAEDFAARYAGWADLVVAQHRRISALERSVKVLSERMAHDPFLAASLHDLLSAVASINAASTILIDTEDIAGEWRDRFHRNIHEDAQRMADVAQSLAGYLDGPDDAEAAAGTPQEELDRWLAARAFFIAELEGDAPAAPETLLDAAPGIAGKAACLLARTHLARYRADAQAMPLAPFRAARDRFDGDPLRIAGHFGIDLAAVLRRLAVVPGRGAAPGLVICDGSGALTHRKPLETFAPPRFAAACPLWPLFRVLAQPMVPMSAVVELPGRDAPRFRAYAVAQPVGAIRFNAAPLYEATMLMIPLDHGAPGGRGDDGVQPIGTSCRICPRQSCAARREPSILSGDV